MAANVGPQLPEDHRPLLQKEEEELAMRPRSLPGTFHCLEVVLRRTLPQAPRKGHKTSSTTAASDPTPPDQMPIAALLHKASSQIQY